jgi:hypothetical protein
VSWRSPDNLREVNQQRRERSVRLLQEMSGAKAMCAEASTGTEPSAPIKERTSSEPRRITPAYNFSNQQERAMISCERRESPKRKISVSTTQPLPTVPDELPVNHVPLQAVGYETSLEYRTMPCSLKGVG